MWKAQKMLCLTGVPPVRFRNDTYVGHTKVMTSSPQIAENNGPTSRQRKGSINSVYTHKSYMVGKLIVSAFQRRGESTSGAPLCNTYCLSRENVTFAPDKLFGVHRGVPLVLFLRHMKLEHVFYKNASQMFLSHLYFTVRNVIINILICQKFLQDFT